MALWKEANPNERESLASSDQPEHPVSVSPAPAPVSTPRSEPAARHRVESVFGPGVTIDGKVEGNSDIRIAGKFTGTIHISGNLNVDNSARVAANITAETVTVEGQVEGNVVAKAELKLMQSGQIVGDLKAASVTVAAGARMRGNVEFGWPKSENEKVAVIGSFEKAKTGSAG